MTSGDEWYSDAALAKQKAAAERTEPPRLTDLVGLLEPRTKPTDDERCEAHGLDAREGAGGEIRNGKPYCGLCLSRGYDDE